MTGAVFASSACYRICYCFPPNEPRFSGGHRTERTRQSLQRSPLANRSEHQNPPEGAVGHLLISGSWVLVPPGPPVKHKEFQGLAGTGQCMGLPRFCAAFLLFVATPNTKNTPRTTGEDQASAARRRAAGARPDRPRLQFPHLGGVRLALVHAEEVALALAHRVLDAAFLRACFLGAAPPLLRGGGSAGGTAVEPRAVLHAPPPGEPGKRHQVVRDEGGDRDGRARFSRL